MKFRDRAVVEKAEVIFAFCSPLLRNLCYASGLRAVPINTKMFREVLPPLNFQQIPSGVIP